MTSGWRVRVEVSSLAAVVKPRLSEFVSEFGAAGDFGPDSDSELSKLNPTIGQRRPHRHRAVLTHTRAAQIEPAQLA